MRAIPGLLYHGLIGSRRRASGWAAPDGGTGVRCSESLRPRTRSLCPAPLHAVDVIACSPLMAVKCLQMAPSCGCVYLHNCEVWVPKALPPTQLASDSDGRFLTCPYSHLGDKATDSLGHWQEGGDRGGGY